VMTRIETKSMVISLGCVGQWRFGFFLGG
jgi:hypothetical protein